MKAASDAGWGGFIVGSILSCMVTVFIMAQLYMMVIYDLQQKAVERGYAEWRLTHAHNGETEFRWLDTPKPPPQTTTAKNAQPDAGR